MTSDQIAARSPAGRRSRLMTPAQMALNREAVLDAARTLFLQRGYDAVCIGDIADRAGVARHVPAHYFGGKQMLYQRLYASLERAVLETLSARLAGGDDPARITHGLAETLMSADWSDLDRLLCNGPKSCPRADALHETMVRRVARAWGDARPDAEDAARFLFEFTLLQARSVAGRSPLSGAEIRTIARSAGELLDLVRPS